ncbi:mpv17-like protein 2 isoform X1 [Lingula anatina]|uniref:Mpv17-like protein 2 isoform X1 n=1 Tax=Lingula anatina TaxID=7574 RepID=A0A1S3J5P5_LINAN|nr:mpv17-like protein 2 isoform X1 [Lingula anatina]|eukprot:XP_013405159.1 mpv17-like protein 2 isoform X1 [Lingula anatina]
MNGVKSIYNLMFGRHLFLTNTISAGVLLGAGDSIVQTFEGRRIKKKGGEWARDWKRTGRMVTIGLVLQGPASHAWYSFLDRILKGTQFKTIAKKILLDQIFASPFFAFGFLMGMGLLEGQSWEKGVQEFKSKFWTVYMADWTVWPAAQCINFYFLPPKLRVIYVNFVTLGWDVFLSYIKHEFKKDQD